MKGATTEPWAKINIPPRKIITNTIGKSQSFLRLFRNNHISIKNDIFVP
jgi:hypothetical protein